MKKIQTCTNIDSNKHISGRMVKLGLLRENCSFLFEMSKTHIATFILHSTSHFFYFFILPIAQFSAAKVWLNNKKKWGMNTYI